MLATASSKSYQYSVLSQVPDSKSQIPHKQQVIKKVAPVSAKKVVISSKDVSSPREGKDGTRKHASDPKHLPDSKSQIPDKKQGITKEVPAGAKKVAIFSKQVSLPCDGKLVSAKQSSNGMPKLPSKTKLSSLSIPGHVNTRRFSEIIIPEGNGSCQIEPSGRQEKIQDENPNGNADTERRSLRRVVDEKLNETKPESEKVVLRHQDVEGKKDVQSLLNNVIEETASKLVQTRKSKVKALVGAFETVISLQDAKSSATTSAQ
ncbi:hypothetical protein F0562_024860 [Nyssa sinensis]|uniref:Calmodulin-binding domain-containing protein n=1 Tax=Nyssa sinensis TaxID=561372 RepID=A0A5J5BGM6_9ASTE|nr:hypothetical protein F0562_024860 [Nyssa sinensis]